MKRILLTPVLLCATLSISNAQTYSRIKSGDIFGTRAFIENKGQYDNRSIQGEKVIYALDNGDEKMFFTDEGLNYEFRKVTPLKDEDESERGEKEASATINQAKVTMRWKGANKDIKVEPSESQSHYITYGAANLSSRTFKKLVFRNVYNGIDIEFGFPPDKRYGIKYNVIVHPGADLSKFKMVYGGDINNCRLANNGDIVIETNFGEVIEHAPRTTYEGGEPLQSSYRLSNNEITLNLPSHYDRQRTIVIDPWLTTITTLATNDYAYDVDYDFLGGVYVYGGTQEYKLAKYNSSGTHLWTFSGVLSAPSWSAGVYAGNFAVHKFNKKCYVGPGFDVNGARVIRLDSTGAYDNFITTPDPNFMEVWDMEFHCAGGGRLFVLGGGTAANISAITVDEATASTTLSTFQPTNNGANQDIASHAVDDKGRLWVLYAGNSGVNNMIAKVDTFFNNNDYTVPSTYNTFAEIQCKSGYLGTSSLSSNGFNALAVNGDYLYYYDGKNLSAYAKSTGSQVGFTTVPGQTVKMQGGIAVDDCNNLYLGGNGNILCYRFNGTAFSPTTSIPLGVTGTTNQFVYDIKLDKQSKVLYVCGSGFLGTYVPAFSGTCPAACFFIPPGQTLLPATHSTCAGGSMSISLSNAGQITGLSYQWRSASSLQGAFFSVAGATTTAYTSVETTNTTYYQALITCTNTSLTFSTTEIVKASGLPDLHFSDTPAVICEGDSAIISVSGASSYTWNTGDEGPQVLLNPAFTSTYNVTGIDVHGCASSSVHVVTADLCTGINGAKDDNSLLVYPNPTNDALSICYKTEKFSVKLFNAYGEKILTDKTTSGNMRINIAALPSGVYFVEISEGSKAAIRKKVVIGK